MKNVLFTFLVMGCCIMRAQDFIQYGVPTVVNGTDGSGGGVPVGVVASEPFFTTNNFAPFGTPAWSDQGLNALGFRSGGEFVMNVEGNNNGGSDCILSTPAGTTNVVISFAARVNTGTGTHLFRVVDGVGNVIYNTNISLTTIYTNVSWTVTSAQLATALTNIAFTVYRQSTSPVCISNLTATFLGTTDPIFQAQNKRYAVSLANVAEDVGIITMSADLGKTFRAAWEGIDTTRSSSFSYVEFITDANVIDFEVGPFGNLSGLGVPQNTVMVDGLLVTNLSVGVNITVAQAYMLKPVTIGVSNRLHTVRFYNSYVAFGGYANALRSVFVPTTNTLYFTRNTPPGRVTFLGDSIISGSGATDSSQSVQHLVASYLGMEVKSTASGGASLWTTWTNGVTKRSIIRALAEFEPSVIWMEHSHNDFAAAISSATYGTNEFAGLVADFLDNAHAVAPAATIYWQSMIYDNVYQSSAVNARGEVVTKYRDAISNACAARPSFAKFIDATAWMVNGDLSDGIHPTTQGQAKYGWNIAEQMWTNRITVAPSIIFPAAITTTGTNTATMGSTGWTNNLGMNAFIYGFTGTSVTQTFPEGTTATLGTITVGMTVPVQPGGKVVGTACAAVYIRSY